MSRRYAKNQAIEMCEFCGDAVDDHDMRALDGCRGCTVCIAEGRPLCDYCDRPMECPIDQCTIHAGDWNGETGNHKSCEPVSTADKELTTREMLERGITFDG